MGTQYTSSEEKSQDRALISAKSADPFSFSSSMAYHEMDVIPVREESILEQLHVNLETLQDLQARMNFMMREIRYLMKV